MIIDKVKPYWKEEDRRKLEEIQREEKAIEDRIARNIFAVSFDELALTEWQDLDKRAKELKKEVEARYIKAHSKKAIIADAEEIINAIEREDYQTNAKASLASFTALKAEGITEEALAPIKEFVVENFDNCYFFILNQIRVQLNALDDVTQDKIITKVKKRVALWYVEPQPAYLPMAHGKATDALAFMNYKAITLDRITGNGSVKRSNVKLDIENLRELQATLGISTDKLLSTALATFTMQNDFRHVKTQPPKREIAIPLKEYALALGYDVEEHTTSTPEEAERERKRAKSQLDHARLAIKKDLDIIHSSKLTWEEPIKGKSKDFDRISLVTRTSIRNGIISISFSPEIAGYLAERNLITQYPTKLLGISGRQPTAYYIGRKLADYYNIDNNQIRGTHDRISIPKLLAVTALPTYEEIQLKDRGHWVERIKDPFELALDTLTQMGVLRDWEYTHAKGIPLTDEEASNLTCYEDFEKLYLHFTLAESPDSKERIEAKQKAREEAKKKAEAKKRKTRKRKAESGS